VSDAIEILRRALGEKVRTDEAVRAAHARDTWVLSDWLDYRGQLGAPPAAVIEAETTADVVLALRTAREHRIAVVPYGAGSGVCGGVKPGADTVVLSTRRMQGLVHLEDRNLVAAFRAGTLGMDAERRVQEAGLTIGHWPQSIELSTVGGWVATRAAGQFSTGYGNIEDVVLAIEAVLPDGRVVRTRETPRAAAGPDLRQLFLGSEGTLGVVTEVTFSLRPLPESSRGQAFHFADMGAGLEAIRLAMRAGYRPPVVRLYDARESRRHFRDQCPSGRAMLLLLHEGPAATVDAEVSAVARIASDEGGEAGDPATVDHWLEHRNEVPSFRTFLEQGIIVDTIEVASTWDRVLPLYEAVTGSLLEVPGMLAATAHSSHSYRSGTNLYFTFGAKPESPDALGDTYLECWRRTMEACVRHGAGLAHHHGIGRVRRDYLRHELGDSGVSLLRDLKRALDPDGLLNPGTLLPDERPAPRSG